ncbi:MAG: radical SAM domain-containing protein [Elusimicrobia bacterium]|nr:MAG: radical SAM domain-containing protein [Elusimicrobiota bacterium]KAF0157973.1 MAG: radical SAM domain-containing protein [Elusimicrobiota bacterium]
MKNGLFNPYFENSGGGLFLANPSGGAFFLKGVSSRRLRGARLGRAAEVFLRDNDFFSGRLDFRRLEERFGEHYFASYKGPHIHIVTLTNRCDLNCVYCSASSNASSADMSRATADRLLEFIFAIKNDRLVLEFQGGEPLLNFGTLRYIVEKARRLNRRAGKKLHFSVVTNLQSMDAGKLDFLERHKFAVCASFDAVRKVHDKNRVSAGGSNYDRVERWLKEIHARSARGEGLETPNAICTVTRDLLPFPAETVDSFVKNGLYRIQLGPLDPLGRAAKAGTYPQERYFRFYRKALERMGELTLRTGRAVYEKGAFNILKSTETAGRSPRRNLELLMRLAYDHNGDIYPSDEARMLANSGDPFFRLGNVRSARWPDVLNEPLARALISSCFGEFSQPYCARCPYSYYCRLSPVYNYIFQGSFWGNLPSSPRCAFFKFMFGLVLRLKRDRRWRRVFAIWLREGGY